MSYGLASLVLGRALKIKWEPDVATTPAPPASPARPPDSCSAPRRRRLLFGIFIAAARAARRDAVYITDIATETIGARLSAIHYPA